MTPQQWAVVRSSIESSTVMGDGGAELVAHVDAQFAERQRRAAGGAMAARIRHERLRDKIIAAADDKPAFHPLHPAWPVSVRERIAAHPEGYGFTKDTLPCDDTMRKAHAHVLAQNPQLAAKTLASSVYGSTRWTQTASST